MHAVTAASIALVLKTTQQDEDRDRHSDRAAAHERRRAAPLTRHIT